MKSPFSFCIVERGCLSLFALVFFHGIYMLFGSFERADFIECLSESSRKRTPRVRRGGPEGYGASDPRGTLIRGHKKILVLSSLTKRGFVYTFAFTNL